MLWLRLQNWLARPLMPVRSRGAAFTEYALLIALIAVVVMVALTTFSEDLAGLFGRIGERLAAEG